MAAYFDTLATPVGEVLVAVDETGAAVRVHFLSAGGFGHAVSGLGYLRHDPHRAGVAAAQLREYLAGTRKAFALTLAPEGTSFQRRVWDLLAAIPYGLTRTYGELAVLLGQASACRAVGAAVGANPLPVLIPCHRVVGAHGELTGFGAGLPTKRFLLRLEGVSVPEQRDLDL